MGNTRENSKMLGKLGVVVLGMFAFGYALVPLYKAICEMTGINILALSVKQIPGASSSQAANTQVDKTRSITVEFDANSRGPWHFKPAMRSLQVHPGELTTVMYEFQNVQNRTMSAQAIPSYAPRQSAAHFNKLECFCFNQYTLEPGEKKEWPVAFVIDTKLPKDVTTITLSYTFFEVGGRTPAAPPGFQDNSALKPVAVLTPHQPGVVGL
jgi:cytochrome c oxidase assembly protein subunit 11